MSSQASRPRKPDDDTLCLISPTPRLDRVRTGRGSDLVKLIDKGVPVYLVEEDAVERGIEPSELLRGMRTVPRGELAGLYAQFDQIWQW